MIAFLAAALTLAAPLNKPPAHAGDCAWVHGRFVVANGSSIQRIWVVGTHRIINLYDDDTNLPPAVARYERDQGLEGDGLYGDFHVCALERSRPGWMQHVRMTGARRLIFKDKPWPPRG